MFSGSLFFVFLRPRDGQDTEFNHWYENVHLAEVLEHPKLVGATRFRLVGDTKQLMPRYMAIYEIADDDPESVVNELRQNRRSIPDAVAVESAWQLIATQISPRQPEPHLSVFEALESMPAGRLEILPDAVPPELVIRSVQAAQQGQPNEGAPLQFVVLTDEHLRREVKRSCAQLQDAPALALICSSLASSDVEAATHAAAGNIRLAAHALGLATSFTTGCTLSTEARDLVGIPNGVSVVGMVQIGKPKEADGTASIQPALAAPFINRWGAIG